MEKTIIKFRSDQRYFSVEDKDIKNWTIRDTSDWDYDRWEEFILSTHIKVQLGGNWEIFFKRKIRHKDIWGKFALITWEPEQ